MAVADASAIISGGALIANLVQSWLDGKLPALYTPGTGSSAKSTTSTSFTDLMSKNITAESDELIIVLAQAEVSNATVTEACRMLVDIGGTDGDIQARYLEQSASSGGNNATLTAMSMATGLSGTVTCKSEYSTSSGGTIHSAAQALHIFQLKYR